MTVEHPQVIKARLNVIATDAMDCIADLQCQVADLRTERDELADRIDSLRQQLGVEIRAKDEWEHNAETAQAERDELKSAFLAGEFPPNHAPRVITAGELREGQLICIHRWHGWGVRAIGEFQGIEGDVVTIKTGGSGTFTESVKFHTIVLLADAPAKDVCTSDPTCKENGEKFTRLTVADLEAAEVGSVLSNGHQVSLTKRESGTWEGSWPELSTTVFGSNEVSALLAELITARVTLTPPEKSEPATNPCTFALVRDEDETGVSGTGKVAEGVIYSDGHVSMRWIVGEHRSTVAYESIEAVEAIHGHGGKTKVVTDD